jgi:acyl-CoA dehydrogenase
MPDQSFLDWPFFGAEHRALAHALEDWCRRELSFHAHTDESVDADCRELVRKLGRDGWLEYVVPRAHGGRLDALDVRSLCLIRETLARHDGLADFVFAMQGLGSGAITIAGTPDQQRAFLPRVARGEAIAAFALTELNSGSDVAGLETRADDVGSHYLINGAKTFISNGGIADFYTMFARTGEGARAKGISAFILDAAAPGLQIAERLHTIAPHPLATITFTDVSAPKDHLLGAAGGGFAIAMATLDMFRSTVGAAALGFARRALDEALARATSRELFGGKLADMPVVQASLADMATEIDAAALLVYRAAWTHDVAKRRNTREAAMAKLEATESAQRVIDQAVQMHGGMGVVRGVPVEALYREIRALRIYEGASEVQRVVIARQVLEAFRECSSAPPPD